MIAQLKKYKVLTFYIKYLHCRCNIAINIKILVMKNQIQDLIAIIIVIALSSLIGWFINPISLSFLSGMIWIPIVWAVSILLGIFIPRANWAPQLWGPAFWTQIIIKIISAITLFSIIFNGSITQLIWKQVFFPPLLAVVFFGFYYTEKYFWENFYENILCSRIKRSETAQRWAKGILVSIVIIIIFWLMRKLY